MSEGPVEAQGGAPQRRSRLSGGACALALLLLAYLTLAFDSASRKSVTVDELGQLPSGLLYLRSGDPRFAALNPPLLNALAALPTLALDLRDDPADFAASDDPSSFWSNGYRFMERHRSDYQRLFSVARAVPIAIVAALGVLLFSWARELVPGRSCVPAALLAAGLLLLSPNVLAQARLVGTDTGTAFFVALALHRFRRMLLRPSGRSVVAAGLTLGLAELTKFYALLLYPVMLGLVLLWPQLYGAGDSRPTRAALLGRFAVMIGISLVVLDSGYLWSEFGARLSDLSLESGALQSLQSQAIGALPLPLPGAYVRAFDGQLAEVGSGMPSFLFGERFQGGRWYYYLALLAIKTPLPVLLAFVLALGASRARGALPLRESALLLAYPLLLFVLLSLGDRRQLGLRALLSAAPLVEVWVAASLVRSLPRRAAGVLAAALVLWLAVVTLRAHPDYLAYFNPFAGGRDGGYRYASDANIDIGQDLPELAGYLEKEGIGKIQLLYFGSVDPALYGIDYEVPTPETLHPGALAVSVSLYHLAYPMYDHGSLHAVGPVVLPGRPTHSIGGSIHFYEIGR